MLGWIQLESMKGDSASDGTTVRRAGLLLVGVGVLRLLAIL